MAYNPDIPQATDLISTSQGQILQNFQALNALFNSVGQYVILPVQAGQPTTSASQLVLYSFTSPNTGNVELYMGRTSTGAAVPFTAGSYGNGWVILPSGILIKWGNDNDTLSAPTGLTTTTKNFPTGAGRPVFASPPFVTITPFYGTAPLDEDNTNTFVSPVAFFPSTDSYTVLCTERTSTTQTDGKIYSWNWMAIGLPA